MSHCWVKLCSSNALNEVVNVVHIKCLGHTIQFTLSF